MMLRNHLLAVGVLGMLLASCAGPEPVAEPTATSEPTATAAAPTVTPVPATATSAPARDDPPPPPPLESLLVPELRVGPAKVIYTQPEREARGLRFWPDGNFGVYAQGDELVFFAANSVQTARTVGNLGDPAATVSYAGRALEDVPAEFSYSAGGPVYYDAESGLLLLFYHAERHLVSDGSQFYSEIGLAVSKDLGQIFTDLGIVVQPELPPDATISGPVEVGGGTVTVKDGFLYLFFRDVLESGLNNNLAVARAPVADVLAAARDGRLVEWHKYYQGEFRQPGRGGRSSALEIGNPLVRWMAVTYNAFLDRFVMVIVETQPDNRTVMHLTVSEDAVTWSPRVPLLTRSGELFYPSIVSMDGSTLETAASFYVYYTASKNGVDRWRDAALERVEVSFTGELVEKSSSWEFNNDGEPEGWRPVNQVGVFEVSGGMLLVEPTGGDPYVHSATLGLSTQKYTEIEVRMRTETAGTGQFFFTSTEAPGISESSSVRFPVNGDGALHTYRLNLSRTPGWEGHLGFLRFDPLDQNAPIEIDFIRLLP